MSYFYFTLTQLKKVFFFIFYNFEPAQNKPSKIPIRRTELPDPQRERNLPPLGLPPPAELEVFERVRALHSYQAIRRCNFKTDNKLFGNKNNPIVVQNLSFSFGKD